MMKQFWETPLYSGRVDRCLLIKLRNSPRALRSDTYTINAITDDHQHTVAQTYYILERPFPATKVLQGSQVYIHR